jgi:hypothetical protein
MTRKLIIYKYHQYTKYTLTLQATFNFSGRQLILLNNMEVIFQSTRISEVLHLNNI